MKEREINEEEYKDIQKHKYRNVEFFTAQFRDHIALEPIHQEVLDMMNINRYCYTDPLLWHDSAHMWSNGLTLEQQRNRVIQYAKDDIDYVLSGKSLQEQKREYLEKRKKWKKQLNFFQTLEKEET